MRLDDNVRGSVGDGDGAVGFDLGGGVNLRAQNETFVSEIVPRVNLRRFAIGDNLDADEYSVGFNNDWTRERYTTGLDFSYVRDSTLSTEATDTGLRDDVTDRDSISVQPNASYLITDRFSLQSSFLFNDVSYIDAGSTGYFDYRYLQGSIGANFMWQDDVTLFANIFVNDFDVKDLDSQTRNYGGQAGATLRWDPTLEASGTLGWIISNIAYVDQRLVFIPFPLPHLVVVSDPVEGTTNGPIASVSIKKIFDSVETKLDYSRQVTPSGRGSLGTADRVAVALEKKLSALLSLQLGGFHEMRSSEDRNAGINAPVSGRVLNRDYTEVRGGIRYRLSNEWMMSANYRHTRNQNDSLSKSEAANANTISIAVEYNGIPNTFWNQF